MNLNIFIKQFAKIYVPTLLVLTLVYSVTQLIPKTLVPTPAATRSQHTVNVAPNPTPSVVQKRGPISLSKEVKQRAVKPAAPKRFRYLIKFISGRSMTANEVRIKGNLVTFSFREGGEVTIAKSEIASIIKQPIK